MDEVPRSIRGVAPEASFLCFQPEGFFSDPDGYIYIYVFPELLAVGNFLGLVSCLARVCARLTALLLVANLQWWNVFA